MTTPEPPPLRSAEKMARTLGRTFSMAAMRLDSISRTRLSISWARAVAAASTTRPTAVQISVRIVWCPFLLIPLPSPPRGEGGRRSFADLRVGQIDVLAQVEQLAGADDDPQ